VIQTIKRESRNQAIGVMVGGPVFSQNPDLALQIGADGTAKCATGAVVLAQKLLDRALAEGSEESCPAARSAG
jgi:methanogenic corrinoid protein MtbC1